MARERDLCVLATAVLVLAGCGGSSEEPEELVAVPYPREVVESTDDASDAAGGGVVDHGGVDGAATDGAATENGELDEALASDGPPLAAVREFLAARGEEARDRDHLLADLSENGIAEVVVATLDQEHEAVVEVGRWDDGDVEVEVTERRTAGTADALGRLRLADLGERASRALILALRRDGATRLAVWNPDENGGLRTPATCPLDTVVMVGPSLGQRLTLTCDGSSGAADALVWREGAFRPGDLGAQAPSGLRERVGPDGGR